MTAAIKHVMWDLCQHGGMTFETYEQSVYGESERFALGFLSERYDEFLRADGPGFNPLKNMAQGGRSVMFRVWSAGGAAPGLPTPDASSDVYWGVYRNLQRNSFKEIVGAISAALPAAAAPLRGEILVDIPMKRRIFESAQEALTGQAETETEVGRREPLWVRLRQGDSRGGWTQLERHTPLVKALADAETLRARKVRVFFSKALLSRLTIDATQIWELVDGAIRSCVGGE